jgi:ABC-type transport system involved in Fe-S cluster assembly fused permease/ATPase subunit
VSRLYWPDAVNVLTALYSVTTSVTLAESRTKLYRKLRDENQFMSQIKTDTLLNWETVKIFVSLNSLFEVLY